MIVNHKYKFIFIHVPKCAGTSIKRALYPHSDKCDQFLGGHPSVPDKNDEVDKHSTALEIKNYVTEERWGEYFTFSFVRNPFSRMVSLYNWWQKTDGKFDLKTKEKINKLSFKEFVFSDYTGKSQVDFLSSKPSKHIFVDYKYRLELDFVGEYERVDRDFAYLCGLFKLPNIKLNKHNASSHNKNYMSYYDEETEGEVRRKFNKDFECFNYK